MTNADLIAIRTFFPEWFTSLKPKTAVILSPTGEMGAVRESMSLIDLETLTIADWNLDIRSDKRWDLCIAINVFMYSKNPSLWFENVFQSCDTIWMIDHVDRDRGKNQLGNDGDAIRYQFLPSVVSSFPNAFDLSLAGQVAKMYTYVNPVTGNAFNSSLQNISMIAEIKSVN